MASIAASRISLARIPLECLLRSRQPISLFPCSLPVVVSLFAFLSVPIHAQDLQDLGARAKAKVEQQLDTRTAPRRYHSQSEERGIPEVRIRAAQAGLQAMRQQRFPEKIELAGRKGSFAIGVSCPVGYVESVEYSFSIEGMDVRRAHGEDCDTPEFCRSWVMNAYPPNESVTYDVTLALSCDADQQAQVRKMVPAARAGRGEVGGEGSGGAGGQGQ